MQKKWKWTIGIGILALLIVGIVLPNDDPPQEPESEDISYSAFMRGVESGAIKNIWIIESERLLIGKTEDGGVRRTYFTGYGQVEEKLRAHGAEVTVMPPDKGLSERLGLAPSSSGSESQDASWMQMAGMGAVSVLVILLIFLGIAWMMRRSAGGAGQAMSFGKVNVRRYNSERDRVTYDDVIGIDSAVEEVKEIRDFLADPGHFRLHGARLPRGILLTGAPGGGKTLLARATACEAGVPFFSISGSEFVEMFVGVGASRVRSLFEQARKSAPCIVFIDEIDAVGRHRGGGLGQSHDEREQTLNQLLVEMDGLGTNETVIVMAATNRPDILDKALTRPGRFDRKIEIPELSPSGRSGILWHYVKKCQLPLDEGVNLEVVARATYGFSGADLESLVNEAALISARARRDIPGVSQQDFFEARLKVLVGLPRNIVLSEDERLRIAYHEAGHVLSVWGEEESHPVELVTILPRGRTLGITWRMPTRELHLHSENRLRSFIRCCYGGRVAEKLVYDTYSTGAREDIVQATHVAHEMVTKDGMSDKVGPVALEPDQESIFLGHDISRRRQEYSEETRREIDVEVKRILQECHAQVEQVLTKHRNRLDALAMALLEHETLGRDEIIAIIDR